MVQHDTAPTRSGATSSICATIRASDDKALKMALDLLRGTASNAAFPPNPKAAIHN
jgi:hypothetical protein